MKGARFRAPFLPILGSALLFWAGAPAPSLAQQYVPKPKHPDQLTEVTTKPATTNLTIQGNLTLETDVLLKLIGVVPDRTVDAKQAEEIAAKFEKFYRDQGYTFARVQAVAWSGDPVILIDEGALAAIHISGLGWYDTFALRNGVLPFAVFNQFRLENELRKWSERKNRSVRYEIETVPRKEGLPLSSLFDSISFLEPAEKIRKTLHESASHELFIYFGEPGELRGTRYGFGYSSANGLELEGEYAAAPIFMEKDRLEADGFVGLARRDSIDPAGGGTIYYANAGLGAKWFTPPLGKDWFRLYLDARFANISDQRPDLPLDQYWDFRQYDSANAEFRIGEYDTVRLSLGYRSHRIYGEDVIASDPYAVADDFIPALASGIDVSLLFGDPQPNYTLNHYLRYSTMNDFRGLDQYVHISTLYYQKVFFRQSVDTILRSSAVWMFGNVEFFDQIAMTKVGMRASFDRRYYVEDAFTQGVEVRFNLYERNFQLAVFDDISVFGLDDSATGNTKAVLANEVGPALYFTLYDAFQVYFNYAFGMATDDSSSHDINLGVKKVF